MMGMDFRVYRLIAVGLVIMLSACSPSLHGSFVTTSYAGQTEHPVAAELGPVEGRSCQTKPLYVLAWGG